MLSLCSFLVLIVAPLIAAVTSSHRCSIFSSQVDLKRANNTEIMLTKVKVPLPDMMIAYFLEPGHDCLVECLPTCKS
ncbi:hypothetical protein P8452_12594 [Trifolium repens]|nr:hypothetical protein P8452_12594 [Trifolium repens]